MLTSFFKRNGVLVAFFVFYLLAVALVLLEMDKQYYQEAKRDIIINNHLYYINSTIGTNNLNALVRAGTEYLRQTNTQNRNQLAGIAWRILDGDNPVYRIAIRPVEERTDAAERPQADAGDHTESFILDLPKPEKMNQYNSPSNSLFLRDFSGQISQPLEDTRGRVYGNLYVFYTTPRDDALIRELTTRYRWYAVFVVLVLTLLAGALAWSLLLPLRNVMDAFERSAPTRTEFITRPRSRLEFLYNRLALEAVFARLQDQLREEIARRPQMTGWEVVEFACGSLVEQLSGVTIGCLEMVAEGPGSIRATGHSVFRGPLPAGFDEAGFAELIDSALPRDGRNQSACTLPGPPLQEAGVLQLIADPERTGIRYLFALALEFSIDPSAYVSPTHLLERQTELVEAGLQTLSLRNQLLVQERGRANISLSRNLGHDLTNIIATSKLELMALDRLLGNGVVPDDARRQELLVETLHGLLRSVKFMQETVNLYRAYAYLQHPVLEITDSNQMINDTLDLFDMSVSAKVHLTRELNEDAPRCRVDPRLIKLALFNLFSNALEAIRKVNPERSARGWIRVITRRSRNGGLCIAVEDSGTGILNSAGNRAQPHEIEKIFELGYTSHRTGGSQGEGLGLNWVRTIVQDLHGGQIWAENTEEAGARFILTFPPVETQSAAIL